MADKTDNALLSRFLPRWQGAGARLVAGLILSALVLLLLRGMASEVFEGETDTFDNAVRAAVHGWASPPLTTFFIVISLIGSPVFIAGAVIVVVAVFLHSGWRRPMAIIATVMIGVVVLDVVLKHVYERARPEPYFGYALPSSFSFPSGHALGSVCFYGTLALLLSSRIPTRAGRAAVWITSIAIILFVGISRIYLGVHYPTDVLAGYITGAIWISAAWMAFGLVYERWAKKQKHGAE